MSDPEVPDPVYFLPGQLDGAAEYLRSWASPPDEISRYVEFGPVDLPDHLLPEVSGFLGRKKRTGRPIVQVIYFDPALGGGESTISVDADGRMVGDVLAAAALTAPGGVAMHGNKNSVMVLVDVGNDTESIVRFAVDALVALAPDWEPRLRARAVLL